MPGHARILQSRPMALLRQRIAVANAAGLHFDPHPAGAGLRNFTFNDFKGPPARATCAARIFAIISFCASKIR